jgi:hypothetical protein
MLDIGFLELLIYSIDSRGQFPVGEDAACGTDETVGMG